MSYGHSAGTLQTKAEFIADATNGKSTCKSLTFSGVQNSVVGVNAISRFLLTGETESEEKVTPVKIGVLMVWQKQDDTWKLLARQAFGFEQVEGRALASLARRPARLTGGTASRRRQTAR